MIRLGNHLLNEDAIEDIHDGAAGLGVYLRSGAHITIPDMTVDEVHEMLAELGLIEFLETEDTVPEFAAKEVAELRKALDEGFFFAAKESTGQVFAFEERAEKGTRSWLHKASSRVMRLHGEFAALSFEDEYPLDICMALNAIEEKEALS